jgi:hypothetical protein
MGIMKKIEVYRYCFLFSLIFLNLGCEQELLPINESNLKGLWLAGAIELDEDNFRPVSQVFKLNDQSEFLFPGMEENDTMVKYSIRQDTLHFPNVSYPLNTVKLGKKDLSLGRWYPLLYRKIIPRNFIQDSSAIRSLLEHGRWSSKYDEIEFDSVSITVNNHLKKEKRKMCWNLVQFNDLYFLRRQGNFITCDYPYESMEYILEISSDKFRVLKWIENGFKEVEYTAVVEHGKEYEVADFQLCDPYIYRNNPGNRYYFKYTNFEGGLYRLRQIFDSSYVKIDRGINNGIVRIGFIINCVGEIGRFDVLTLNYDYEKVKLNPAIAEQLVSILSKSGNWNPGERNGKKIDTFKYLSFKIKDGRIIEIFP